MTAARWSVTVTLAALGAVAAPTAAPLPAPNASVHLRIRVDRTAPSWAGDELREDLRIAATREDCPIQLTVVPEDAPADIIVSIRIASFDERSEPGGAPILDLQTGRQRPGKIHFAEARWGIELFVPGEAEPRFARAYSERATAATTATPGFDPRQDARRRAVRDMSARVLRLVCKTLRKLR